MEFKGTQGKWYISPTKKGNYGISCGINFSFAKVYFGGENTTDKYKLEQRANALLISKAPEMLEMLKKLYLTNSLVHNSDHVQVEQLIKSATEITE